MASARPSLRRVVVVGDGQVGLLAACALRRSCPTTEIIMSPASGGQPGLADGAHTSLPSLARLHRRIGLDERGMVARASASHRLATRFEQRGGGYGRTIGYGAIESETPGLPGWRSTGAGVDGEPSSLAAALAEAGRFRSPSHDPASRASGLDYALRFDPDGHRARLRSLARHLGVLVGGDGTRTADADLVVETAQEDRGGWIDWTGFMVADRIDISDGEVELSPLDRVVAAPDAITLVSPGRDRTRIVRLADTGGASIGSGRVAEPWVGNRVRIGDAAAALPPIGWTNLHLATVAIELLIELLPGRDIDHRERAEYNRRWALGADCVLDFVAGHLAVAARADTPFWRRVAEAPRPPGLAHRLEEHRRRGRLPHHEEDSIPRELWIQLLARRSGTRLDAEAATAEPYAEWFARTGGDAS